MRLGEILADESDTNSNVHRSWIGSASWIHMPEHFPAQGQGTDKPWNDFATLTLSVPSSFLGTALDSPPRAHASWLPFRDSGLALVTVVAEDEVVVVVVDMAGSEHLGMLQQAADIGTATTIGTVSDDDWEPCPHIVIDGLHETLAHASAARRLTAKEFESGVAEVRSRLRTDAIFRLLGGHRRKLHTLTIDVCEPLTSLTVPPVYAAA